MLTTLSKKREVDSIIRDTIDKVLVLRFGRGSDPNCLHLDQIVCFPFVSFFNLSCFIFRILYDSQFKPFTFHLCYWYSFLKQQERCQNSQPWHLLMLTLLTFKFMSNILTSLWFHLHCFSSMPITWKWILGMILLLPLCFCFYLLLPLLILCSIIFSWFFSSIMFL